MMWGVMRPLSPSSNLSAAEITQYLGVTSGLMMYLCLWNTVAKMRVSLVSFIHMNHDWGNFQLSHCCQRGLLGVGPPLPYLALHVSVWGIYLIFYVIV